LLKAPCEILERKLLEQRSALAEPGKEEKRAMKAGSKLTLALCCAVLTSSFANAADDQEGRKACMMDALTICAQFIPDRDRIANCLLTNLNKISGPCRAQLVRYRG
jgi:hypothetical protein